MNNQKLYIYVEILNIFVQDHTRTYSLVELTDKVLPVLDIGYILTEKVAHQRANQAMVLDVLLLLDDEKIIVLDSNTDESFIHTQIFLRI
ncbi:hypothetical protein EV143_1222 [Flavobacterium chryseum]|nr:hypothetical protein EV143_1222 [Flavobacterium sp. P3160]